MYQIGQTVQYGTEGVCTIEERQLMKVGRTKSYYYVLKPVARPGATIFVPEDNELLLSRMRPVLSAEEIHAMLLEVTKEELEWIDDPNERKAEYQKILLAGERLTLLRLIRRLYLHKQQLQSKGKHLRIGDEQLLRDAEKLLNDEFSLVLNISQHEVPAFIRSQIEISA